jgi:hypothetical protein
MKDNAYPLTLAVLMTMGFPNNDGVGDCWLVHAANPEELRAALDKLFEQRDVLVVQAAIEAGYPVRYNGDSVLLPYQPRYCDITLSN